MTSPINRAFRILKEVRYQIYCPECKGEERATQAYYNFEPCGTCDDWGAIWVGEDELKPDDIIVDKTGDENAPN